MTRYHAAFYHLLISLAIFAVLTYLVLAVWYPGFFFSIDGGWEGMRIIIFVDIVLGPTLTLVVFKANKPGLKFDLTLIGLFQAVCLLAGTFIVYSERPVFFVYYDRHFYSSSADTFTRYGLESPDPARFSATTPAKVISLLPENPIEEADVRRILYQDGIPAWVYSPTYQPLEAHLPKIIDEGVTETSLRDRDTGGNLDRWLQKHDGKFSDFAFYPIHSRYRDAFLAIRRSNLAFEDIIEIPPPM